VSLCILTPSKALPNVTAEPEQPQTSFSKGSENPQEEIAPERVNEEELVHQDGKEEKEIKIPEALFAGPLRTSNFHPLYTLFFVPPSDRAKTLAHGKTAFSFRTIVANTIIKEIEGGSVVDLDLETWDFTFTYRRGLKNGELQIVLPLRFHSHGMMDNLIDRWHRLWGLPRGKRPNYPSNDFRFFTTTSGGKVFNFPSDEFSLADVSIIYKRAFSLRRSGDTIYSYRIGLKFPTGSSKKGLGSGGFDYDVGILWESKAKKVLRFASVDATKISRGDLNGLAKNYTLTTLLGAEYKLRPSLNLVGQLIFSKAPYKTGSPDADRDSLELWLGFHRFIGQNVVFSGGFSEDIVAETAPDFGLVAQTSWLF